MNLNEVLAAPVTAQFGDKEVIFNRLTLKDWGLIASKLEAKQKQLHPEMISAMTKSGVTIGQTSALLREIYRPPTYNEIYQYLFTPEGALMVLTISLQKVNPDMTSEDVEKLSDIDMLMGLAVVVSGANNVKYQSSKKESISKDFLVDTSTKQTG